MHKRNGCHLALFAMLRGASLHLNKEGEDNRIPIDCLRPVYPTAETTNRDSRTVSVIGKALWLPVWKRKGPPASLPAGPPE